jgi:transcription elongation factor GreA
MNAEIIKAGSTSKVGLGSKVELKTGNKTVTFSVVGPVEADPLEGKISDESPIGEALLGKKVGDHAVITTPKGEIDYEIVKIG